MYQTCPRVLLESCKKLQFLSDTLRIYGRVCLLLVSWKNTHWVRVGGSSTTITQAAVGKKKTAISQTRQLKLGYYRNPLSMPGLQPTEPMYSWGYSEGDCCGFSLRFSLLEENNRDKAFHLLHTKEKKRKNQSLGFFIVVKTSWKGALPPPPLPPRCLSCLCPYLLNQRPLLIKREGPPWFRRDVSLS